MSEEESCLFEMNDAARFVACELGGRIVLRHGDDPLNYWSITADQARNLREVLGGALGEIAMKNVGVIA